MRQAWSTGLGWNIFIDCRIWTRETLEKSRSKGKPGIKQNTILSSEEDELRCRDWDQVYRPGNCVPAKEIFESTSRVTELGEVHLALHIVAASNINQFKLDSFLDFILFLLLLQNKSFQWFGEYIYSVLLFVCLKVELLVVLICSFSRYLPTIIENSCTSLHSH